MTQAEVQIASAEFDRLLNLVRQLRDEAEAFAGTLSAYPEAGLALQEMQAALYELGNVSDTLQQAPFALDRKMR